MNRKNAHRFAGNAIDNESQTTCLKSKGSEKHGGRYDYTFVLLTVQETEVYLSPKQGR